MPVGATVVGVVSSRVGGTGLDASTRSIAEAVAHVVRALDVTAEASV